MVGDVVLTPFPYTNLADVSASKARPAIVLSEVGMGDWVLCLVTSRAARPGDIPITGSDLAVGSLTRSSNVRPVRLATLNDRLFQRTVGRLTDAKLAEVLAAVRNLF